MLDRAKKVLFPEKATEATAVKMRRSRMKQPPCSLAMAANNDKENKIPRKRGEIQKMDSLAFASSGVQQQQQQRGFRRRAARNNLKKQCDSLSALSDSNQSIDTVSNGSFNKKERRRCHHVSSLEQPCNNHAINKEARSRGYKSVSSLMNLSSSTQKPQKKPNQHQQSKKNEMDLIQNIQSMHLSDTSTLQNSTQTIFQSPQVDKHRPLGGGGCTSPPNILHCLSKSIFKSTPGSSMVKPPKKRMDQKKTPAKFAVAVDGEMDAEAKTNTEECESGEVSMEPSPLVTEFNVTPQVGLRQRKNGVKQTAASPCTQQAESAKLSDCKDMTPGFSPQVAKLASPPEYAHPMTDFSPMNTTPYAQTQECTFECRATTPGVNSRHLLSPLIGHFSPHNVQKEELICAKANLFPAGFESEEVGAVEKNQPVGVEAIRGSAVFDVEVAESGHDSNTSVNESIRGSSVLEVEMATPRLVKLKSASEGSSADAKKKDLVRGSAVLSVHKAPLLSKASVETKCNESLRNKAEKKNNKPKHKHSSMQSSSPDTSREIKVAQEGTRKSSRESKQTDRYSVDSATQSSDNTSRATKATQEGVKKSSRELKQSESSSHTSCATKAMQKGIRKSSRESKQTDRFTVESWTDNNNKKVRFTNNVDVVEILSSDESDGEDAKPLSQLVAAKKESNKKATKSTQPLVQPLADEVSDNIKDSKPSQLEAKENASAHQSTTPSCADEWSTEEISTLRTAQSRINPTSSTYWEDIATLIEGKSASECRDKWFSLVSTPKGRPPKEKKQQLQSTNKTDSITNTNAYYDEEDDLFESTPLREALLEVQNDALSKITTTWTTFGLSPCIQSAAMTNPAVESSLKDRRKGYKTYLDKLRKDLKPLPKTNARMNNAHNVAKGHTSARLDSGEWGKVMADGSLKMSMPEESEDEMDDLFDEDED